LVLRHITVSGLTGLTLLGGNVIKIRNSFLLPNFEQANSGQVHVETVVIPTSKFYFLMFSPSLTANIMYSFCGFFKN